MFLLEAFSAWSFLTRSPLETIAAFNTVASLTDMEEEVGCTSVEGIDTSPKFTPDPVAFS